MTKSYFKMIPTTCQPAECEGRYLGETVMTKSHMERMFIAIAMVLCYDYKRRNQYDEVIF